MPQFNNEDTTIYYEERGRGYPVLLFAPGGMDSTVENWSTAKINPLARFSTSYRLIAMDQRNAGRSTGPLDSQDPWGSFADDQLALIDHLGIDTFHVMGCCIGGPFALKLIERAPARITSAVLQQPVAISDDNAPLYDAMWRTWGEHLQRKRPDLTTEQLEAFGTRMWNRDFVLSVDRDVIASCTTPLLILPGTDRYHPTTAGREIAALAPQGQLLEPWNDTPARIDSSAKAVGQFLRSHTPDRHQQPRAQQAKGATS